MTGGRSSDSTDLSPGTGAFTRRRLFELGATSVGLATVLAACGNDEAPAPGRVGQAPAEEELSELEVDDVVYLRTLTSLEYTIVAVYAALSEIEGMDEEVVALLQRLSADHQAAADEFAALTTEAGGEPYECENQWLMGRTMQPLLDHITGSADYVPEVPPSDDPSRDALTVAGALETIDAATAQLYIERFTDPALRVPVITAGTAASRRAATTALRSNPPPEGYVSPLLVSGTDPQPTEDGVIPQFAIATRFGQLTPVEVQVGAPDENGQRFTTLVQTPAENAYIYDGATCPA